jgi:flagellar biosynthesis protein FlhG
VLGAANIAHARKVKVLRHIRKLDAEVVLIDVGAGISFNAVDFFSLADLQLTVATPQLTSLQNAYSFTKSVVFRHFSELAKAANREEVFTRATTRGETERVAELLERIAAEEPALAQTMRNSVRSRRGGVIGNQMETRGQANVLHALSRMLRDFLGVEAPVLAALCQNPRINRSVTKRVPFLSEPGTDAESTAGAPLRPGAWGAGPSPAEGWAPRSSA